MNKHASGPGQGSRDGPDPTSASSSTEGAKDGRTPALPGILAETLEHHTSGHEGANWTAVLTADDRARLGAAIDRRGGRATLDHGLVVELVEAVLPESLAALVDGTESRRRLVGRIARALLDDPVSANRLQALVAALGEGGGSDAHAAAGGQP